MGEHHVLRTCASLKNALVNLTLAPLHLDSEALGGKNHFFIEPMTTIRRGNVPNEDR